MLRKIFTATVALLILCGCSGGAANPGADTKPEASPTLSDRPVSSIFGRNISYGAFSPVKEAELPVPAEKIADVVQIEKRLYFLACGSVFYLDIETGESGELFKTPAVSLCSHGGRLYAYTAESSVISEYDPDGSLLGETVISADGGTVQKIYVTDSFYVFKRRVVGEVYIDTTLTVFSRETGEQTLEKKAPNSGVELFPYKGDRLLTLIPDTVFTGTHLGVFDAKTGDTSNIRELYINYSSAVAYCPKTDTAIVYGMPGNVSFGDDAEPETVSIPLTEYSLQDSDSIVLNRYYIDISYGVKFFVGTYENAVCTVSPSENKCRVYDYLDPPESITILGNETDPELIESFEMASGILVRTAYTDYDKIALKLMAGDDDFGIFNTGSGFHSFVGAGAYVDLKTVESLEKRISTSPAAELCASYDGKYFGVPAHVFNYAAEEYYPENGSPQSYSLAVSEMIYCAENVDAAEKSFADPDGEELYKLLKYINENPTGNREKMPFGDGAAIYAANVYMMNPKSRNYDNTVKFLEYIFDSYSGAIPGVVPEERRYPELESGKNCYAEWRCRPLELIGPIMQARNKAMAEDLSRSELRALAREAAAETAMRMGE